MIRLNGAKFAAVLVLTLLVCLIHTTEVCADTITLDPSGDTFGTGAVRHDITSVNANVAGSSITFTVNFAGQVFAPSAGGARSVVGYIDIDADRNSLTGAAPFINTFGPGPAVALGDEFAIDLFSEELQAGSVDVLGEMSEVIGTAPIAFGANSFSVTVPLSLLGASDGLVNYGVLVGTFLEVTDRAPNGSLPATSQPVPEPTTLLLIGTGLAGIASRLRRKRTPSLDA